MKLWKYSGILFTATGIIHTLTAIAMGWNVYREIFSDGFINSIGEDYERSFTLWFLVCGILLIFIGQTLHYYIKKEQKPAPLALGYATLIFSVIGCLMEPISGFWLFIPQALIIIFARREKNV